MMNIPAMTINNIGKKYSIGSDQSKQVAQYNSLRDTIATTTRNLLSRKKDPKKQSTKEFWAVENIDLTINQGDRIGIIGRNGAGKSTLLKLLSRITHPTKGEIILNGRVSSLLEVGTGFHPELTGRENIFLNGAILGMPRSEIRQKFNEIVEFAGIEKFLDTPVKRYSSGMYTRLAFSVAAHLESEILLIDEVLAVGDAEFQKKCLGKMEDIGKEEGRTVIFVSHNMNAIQELCNRVILLEKGRIKIDTTDIEEAISLYFSTHVSEAPIWETSDINKAVHNDIVITKAYVSNSNNEIEQTINNQKGGYINIEFNLTYYDPALSLGYAIYDETGVLLYWSYFTDSNPDRWIKPVSGANKIRGFIPPHLLNQGTYRVEIIASYHYREWIFKPGESPVVIHFKIFGGLSQSPHWAVKRPGLLAPILSWETYK